MDLARRSSFESLICEAVDEFELREHPPVIPEVRCNDVPFVKAPSSTKQTTNNRCESAVASECSKRILRQCACILTEPRVQAPRPVDERLYRGSFGGQVQQVQSDDMLGRQRPGVPQDSSKTCTRRQEPFLAGILPSRLMSAPLGALPLSPKLSHDAFPHSHRHESVINWFHSFIQCYDEWLVVHEGILDWPELKRFKDQIRIYSSMGLSMERTGMIHFIAGEPDQLLQGSLSLSNEESNDTVKQVLLRLGDPPLPVLEQMILSSIMSARGCDCEEERKAINQSHFGAEGTVPSTPNTENGAGMPFKNSLNSSQDASLCNSELTSPKNQTQNDLENMEDVEGFLKLMQEMNVSSSFNLPQDFLLKAVSGKLDEMEVQNMLTSLIHEKAGAIPAETSSGIQRNSKQPADDLDPDQVCRQM